MELVKTTEAHIRNLMGWFSSEQSLKDWAGPGFRFPYDLNSFTADLNMDALVSRSLVADDGRLLGFGQFYPRLGRCHLGRLVVNPECRGQGLAADLIERLSALGLPALQVSECSLFVLSHNCAAINAYKRCGFKEERYPEALPLEGCIYMVRRASDLTESLKD